MLTLARFVRQHTGGAAPCQAGMPCHAQFVYLYWQVAPSTVAAPDRVRSRPGCHSGRVEDRMGSFAKLCNAM
jgi:hypothetical protein